MHTHVQKFNSGSYSLNPGSIPPTAATLSYLSSGCFCLLICKMGPIIFSRRNVVVTKGGNQCKAFSKGSIQTPYPEHMPLMQASQGSESRIPQSSPRVGCPQMLALVGSLCKSLWGRGKPPPSDSKSLVQPSGSSP